MSQSNPNRNSQTFESRAAALQEQQMQKVRQQRNLLNQRSNSNQFPQEQQSVLKDFYVKIFSQFLFGNTQLKHYPEKVEYIIGKLPEIIYEWQYAQQFLKEKGFNFKDKPVSNFSGQTNLKEFFHNLNGTIQKYVEDAGVKIENQRIPLIQKQQSQQLLMKSSQKEREQSLGTNIRRRQLLQLPAQQPQYNQCLNSSVNSNAFQNVKNEFNFGNINFKSNFQKEETQMVKDSEEQKRDQYQKQRERIHKRIKVETVSSEKTIEKMNYEFNRDSYLNSYIPDKSITPLEHRNLEVVDFSSKFDTFEQNHGNLHISDQLIKEIEIDFNNQINLDQQYFQKDDIIFDQKKAEYEFFQFNKNPIINDYGQTNNLILMNNQNSSINQQELLNGENCQIFDEHQDESNHQVSKENPFLHQSKNSDNFIQRKQTNPIKLEDQKKSFQNQDEMKYSNASEYSEDEIMNDDRNIRSGMKKQRKKFKVHKY